MIKLSDEQRKRIDSMPEAKRKKIRRLLKADENREKKQKELRDKILKIATKLKNQKKRRVNHGSL